VREREGERETESEREQRERGRARETARETERERDRERERVDLPWAAAGLVDGVAWEACVRGATRTRPAATGKQAHKAQCAGLWVRLGGGGVAVGGAPVGEQLQRVGCEAVLVHQHVVVRGLVGALDARVRVEEEVVLERVTDLRRALAYEPSLGQGSSAPKPSLPANRRVVATRVIVEIGK
jgi:hypothetical protein